MAPSFFAPFFSNGFCDKGDRLKTTGNIVAILSCEGGRVTAKCVNCV